MMKRHQQNVSCLLSWTGADVGQLGIVGNSLFKLFNIIIDNFKVCIRNIEEYMAIRSTSTDTLLGWFQ